MFLSETHLPQVLETECYHGPKFFELEQQHLFRHIWHCVGTIDELPQEGSFVTQYVGDYPVVLWRRDGQPRAFLNVCAHRFANLTTARCGQADKLTCQYHGWQYDASGRTQRIPDAASFKPLANQQLGLTKLPLELRGRLIFLRLPPSQADEHACSKVDGVIGETLERQLGPAAEVVCDLFGERYSQVFSKQTRVPANWKIIIENAIESYHVGCVHAKSFSLMPAAENCNHQLHPEFTRFETTSPSQAPALLRFIERSIHRQLGIPHVERYRQYHLYPNTMLSTSKMISVLMVVEPKGPRESLFHLRIFGNRGSRRGPLSRIAFQIATRWAIREVNKVLQEDFEVIPSIQAGIESPALPSDGFISIREERIFHFQNYIKRVTSKTD